MSRGEKLGPSRFARRPHSLDQVRGHRVLRKLSLAMSMVPGVCRAESGPMIMAGDRKSFGGRLIGLSSLVCALLVLGVDPASAGSLSGTPGAAVPTVVVIGETPVPPSAADLYVVPAAYEALRIEGAASAEAAIAEDIAVGATQPIPSNPESVPPPGNGGNPSASAQVALATNPQEEPTWCVPASVQVMLTTPKYNLGVSQASLAAEMQTNSTTGTYFPEAVNALNSHEGSFRYFADDSTSSPPDLVARVANDVYNSAAPTALAGQASALPWWQQHHMSGYHAIIGYGYWTQSGGGLYVYDPIEYFPGPYKVSASAAYAYIEGQYSGVPNLVW